MADVPPLTAVLVGAGQRGRDVYGAWALRNPDRLRFVAVADPDLARRSRFAFAHGAAAFAEAEALFEARPAADLCVIASPDLSHHRLATLALDAGFHVLMEKPMAASLDDAADLVRRASRATGSLHVAHVLRYTRFFAALHQIVRSGRLGDVVTVEHRENVAAWHMAHSFVRGNWGRAQDATPMIVQKCCHDFDLLAWNLAFPVRRVASVGSLYEFRPERAPAGATPRCTDGCPEVACPYDARRIYLDRAITGWPVTVVADDLSLESRLEALRTGPYGRCAYTAGSDVVDHQIVVMEFEDGVSASLTVHGHSGQEGRTMRYDGTRATLRGSFGRAQMMEVIDHASGEREEVAVAVAQGGHGGGDEEVIEGFLRAVTTGEPSPTTAAESLESHLLAFSAEEARLSGMWVDVGDRRRGLP